MAAMMSSMLGSYYSKTGLTPADLRNEFLRNAQAGAGAGAGSGEQGAPDPVAGAGSPWWHGEDGAGGVGGELVQRVVL
jgi:hypothetical protein